MLAKELYPGKYRPTLTHLFIKLLSDKGLLGLCFTQNVDTLERLAGIPANKIIEAHGSFATQCCVECMLTRDHQYHTHTKPIDMRHHWTQWMVEQALPSAKVNHFAAGLGLLANEGECCNIVTNIAVRSPMDP